jgi:hypothetical protein
VSPLDPRAGHSGSVGFKPGGSPDVRLTRPATPTYAPPPMPPVVRRHTHRMSALVVIALTLACTALALYDLVLLAFA